MTDIGSKQVKSSLNNRILIVSVNNTLMPTNKTDVLNSPAYHNNQIIETESPLNNDVAVTKKTDQHSLFNPEPKFYTIKELDHPPEMTGEIDPRPAALAQYREAGEIKIQIWIDEKGNVVKSEVIESNLPQAFIDYTLTSFDQSKFTAGIKDSVPVRSVAKVVVQYTAIN